MDENLNQEQLTYVRVYKLQRNYL